MQDKNTAHHSTESRIRMAEKLQLPSIRSFKSPVNRQELHTAEAWGNGFVKPDGTRIRLFVPPKA